MKPIDLNFPYHFVVLDQRWCVLLKGTIDEQQRVELTFRHSAPNDGRVSESYSDFGVILNMILPGTLPTIQFGDEAKINQFILDAARGKQ